MDSTFADQWRELQSVHRRLSEGADVPDIDVLTAVGSFRLATNCDCAAQAYFAAVAPVLAFREHLAPALLRYPTEPLYFLGIDDSEGVFAWVRHYLGDEGHYLPLAAAGRTWLSERLSDYGALIEQIFKGLAEENNE